MPIVLNETSLRPAFSTMPARRDELDERAQLRRREKTRRIEHVQRKELVVPAREELDEHAFAQLAAPERDGAGRVRRRTRSSVLRSITKRCWPGGEEKRNPREGATK
jgi:hypothetical protein